MAKVIMDPRLLVEQVMEKVKKNLIALGMEVRKEAVRSMGGYGSYSRLDTKQEVKGSKRGKGKKAGRHYPSPPGSPPAVDTGRLRDSISISWTGGPGKGEVGKKAQPDDGVNKPEDKMGHFIVVVGTNLEYSSYLEFGTRKMAPRPYLRPAFDKLRNSIMGVFK